MTVNGRIQMVPFLRLAIVLVLGIVVGDAIAVTHCYGEALLPYRCCAPCYCVISQWCKGRSLWLL